jgi:hypothetical protein
VADLPRNCEGERRWLEIEDKKDKLLQRLWEAPGAARLDHDPKAPRAAGVYLFVNYVEDEPEPWYVGQTRNIRDRLNNHCQPSSGHGKAHFAFNIARGDLETRGMDLRGTRKDVEEREVFRERFTEAKKQVDALEVRFACCEDPELRTVFEVFAAVRLGTRYNSFQTT